MEEEHHGVTVFKWMVGSKLEVEPDVLPRMSMNASRRAT